MTIDLLIFISDRFLFHENLIKKAATGVSLLLEVIMGGIVNFNDEINVLLGPLQYLLFDIPFISDVEDYIGDTLIGAEVEEQIQNGAANIELPSDEFENTCEK